MLTGKTTMTSIEMTYGLLATICFLTLFALAIYHVFIVPFFNPLKQLCGPPIRFGRIFGGHVHSLLDPLISPRAHKVLVEKYGRSVVIQGFGSWDIRLFSLDPLSLSHILKNSTIYEKPELSRRLITSLVGLGMFSSEGQVHRRQRRVAAPAFSVQNLRALVPVVFGKGGELRDRWVGLMGDGEKKGIRLDVNHWLSRATFDVIGLAGFDYQFNAIESESNELFNAYKEMFEVAISRTIDSRTVLGLYFPIIDILFPDKAVRTVARCHEVIRRVAGHLVQEKKRKIAEAEKSDLVHSGKDLLSLLLKSNAAEDLPPEHRISDDDILHNINTFMFAGTDSTSLALTWTLLLLAQHPQLQTRLRHELLSVAPAPASDLSTLTADELGSLHETLSTLPYLNNVSRESLRLIPPIHSSLRVATQDDEVPTSYPVRFWTKSKTGYVEKRTSVFMPKGCYVHIPVEGFNLDREIWGDDAWEFNPDRWDDLPAAVQDQPGLFSNLLTFSAGPRSCIGMRFSMIEMKVFLYILLTNFVFEVTGEKIVKRNVILTRPYLSEKIEEGSQCPLFVRPFRADEI